MSFFKLSPNEVDRLFQEEIRKLKIERLKQVMFIFLAKVYIRSLIQNRVNFSHVKGKKAGKSSVCEIKAKRGR